LFRFSELVSAHTDEMIRHKGWLSLSSAALQKIPSLDALSITEVRYSSRALFPPSFSLCSV
jgi:hypothetical protein